MKTAFISPRMFSGASRARARVPGSFPSGFGYMAACLRRAGHEARIYDPDITGMTMEQVWVELEAFRPDVAGVTCVTANAMEARRVIAEAKSRLGCLTLLGGPHATALPRSTVQGLPELDAVIMGEGEVPMLALAEEFSRSGKPDLAKIPGAAFLRGGEYVQNPMPSPMEDLDSLPYPALDLLAGGAWRAGGRRPVTRATIISSRGCPSLCTFCANARMGRRFRARSPKNVVDELEFLKREYGTRSFEFFDDCFTADPKRAYEICRLILERRLDITWAASAKVNTLLDPELVKIMRAAGCNSVNVGVETSSPEIAKIIKKGTTPEQAVRACALLRAGGIPFSAGFMLGNETETLASALDTISFALRLKTTFSSFNITIPLPGTELFDKYYKDFDRPGTNWDGWASQGPRRPYTPRHTALTDRQLWLLVLWAHLRFFGSPLQLFRMITDVMGMDD